MGRWLDLQQFIRSSPKWTRVTAEVSGFVVPAVVNPWGAPLWVAIYRRWVRHRASNFQLDLFDPDDGHCKYSAVTSNLDYTLANLWYFMAGRGVCDACTTLTTATSPRTGDTLPITRS